MMNAIRLAGAVGIMAGLVLVPSAHAAPITYTFQGTGSGVVTAPTGGPTAFTASGFTFALNGDTTNLVLLPPSAFQFGLGGTFVAGPISATLTANNIVVLDPISVGFFNGVASNGGAILSVAFGTYGLDTSFGPITGTGASLVPDLLGGSFATTGGGTVAITAISSLTFTALLQSTQVPEPATLALLLAGLVGLGAVRRLKAA